MSLEDSIRHADAEEIVMGQVLIDHNVITKAARLLKPEHFGDSACRHAYEACLSLWRQGIGVDLLTAADELHRTGKMPGNVKAHDLARWTNRVASPRHFEDHAELVRRNAGTRLLRKAGEGLILGTNRGTDPADLLPALSDAMSKAVMADVDDGVRAGEHAAKMMDTAERPNPIYLGIESLDGLVFILPGNVVTIRAAAGVGKTAFVLSAMLNLVPRHKCWFVSLEMAADEVIMRALCQLAGVDMDRVMEGRMSEAERDAMAKAAISHADMLDRLVVDNSGSMSIDEFMAKAEHKVKNEGVEFITIDYAQLMQGVGEREVDRLKAISLGVRGAARKLNVPILLIVHVNKQGQDDGSSQFEKDAHVRLSLSREPHAPTMDVEVLKNRNGRVGNVQTPCHMAHGIVGRNGPPYWAASPTPPTFNPRMPHPDNHIEPTGDFAPF
jgi:replicative DNA helicase